MLDESAEQYSEDEANYPELLLNQGCNSRIKLLNFELALLELLLASLLRKNQLGTTLISLITLQTASCLFSRRLFQADTTTDPDKIKARFGSSAIYVHNEVSVPIM